MRRCNHRRGRTAPFRKPWVSGLIYVTAGMLAGFFLGCRLLTAMAAPDSLPPEATSEFRLITEAWNQIQKVYVDRSAVTPQNLAYGAVRGMVDGLGDTGHSRFLTPEMVRQERQMMRGRFEGIGAEVRMKNKQVVIVAPMDGSPALKAGLKAGDIILKVDDQEIGGLSLEEVVNRIQGPAGTRVKLTILSSKTGEPAEISLVRARIALQRVRWQRLPGTEIAHLRIAGFSGGTTANLQKALEEMKREKVAGLILDMRNNPGGLFSEAISTASQFLAGGNVLLEKDAAGKTVPVPVRSGGIALDLPMVVLINGGSASAAEIVSGALRDGRRATIVGEKSFGTGTVLEIFPLSDGSALLLAVKEWLTPGGQRIWHNGIAPDIEVPLPFEASPLFPQAEIRMTAAELRASGDLQLLRALELLTPSPARPQTADTGAERERSKE